MKLILPKTYIDPADIRQPIFFLAGPDRGGGNWQEQCCVELAKHLPEFSIVVPCWRWTKEDKLFRYRVSGVEDRFYSRTAWEHYYLNFVAEKSREHQGCIIFWLPAESKEQPRSDGQVYAKNTYGELGGWRRSFALDPSIHLAVGAEPNFPGLDDIQENFNLDTGKNFHIYSTLEETAKDAVQWVLTTG